MTVTLDTINTAAADLIETVGWTQHTERDDKGRVCLTGALRHCQPQPGDDYLAQGVYRRLGHGENWNDDENRTAEEVVAYLREHPVTDEALAAAYGPQWEAVVALVRRAAVLTAAEATVLRTAPDSIGDGARGAAWDAARDAAQDADRDAAKNAARKADRDAARSAAGVAAWDAVGVAAQGAARNSIWEAARDAAWALVVRDLLLATPDGTAHYRTLTLPWANTIGPVHPDDDKD